MGESRERKKMLDDWRRKWAQFVFAEEKRVRLLGFPMQNGEKIINLYLYIVKKKKKKWANRASPARTRIGCRLIWVRPPFFKPSLKKIWASPP